MKIGRVLIADEMHLSIIGMLEKINYDPDYRPEINREEILEIINNYDGLIIRSKTKIDEAFLNQANNLKFIGRAGAGLDLIDLEMANKKNIKIFAANEGNRVAVAEHVLGMILCLINNIHLANDEVKNKIWKRERNRGTELYGKTVGIIGYGNNGKETAKRFAAFGCKVLAFDKYLTNFSDEYVIESSMQELYNEVDILSLHIPLTHVTYQLVNDQFIENFKKPFYLVNASRGEVAVLSSISDGIKEGKVLGACLDVLENEKLNKLTDDQTKVFEYLATSSRVLLTPHIAGWTHESYIKINEVLIDKITNAYESNT